MRARPAKKGSSKVEQMLKVYEITGKGGPQGAPSEGLEGVWPEPPFYYLFYRKESPGAVSGWLKSRPGLRLTGSYELPYEKWQDVSERELSLGRFDIAKSADFPDKPGRTRLIVDPGVVFGSGLHPTTQGCLLAISEIFASNEIRTVVDFGAGTGDSGHSLRAFRGANRPGAGLQPHGHRKCGEKCPLKRGFYEDRFCTGRWAPMSFD